jgi:glycosyltransferase A (GT-A) superfamily protein (DUF2064 family)
VPRMSKKKRLEMSLFINPKGRLEFNRLCRACVNGCKQSHVSVIVSCPKIQAEKRWLNQ